VDYVLVGLPRLLGVVQRRRKVVVRDRVGTLFELCHHFAQLSVLVAHHSHFYCVDLALSCFLCAVAMNAMTAAATSS